MAAYRLRMLTGYFCYLTGVKKEKVVKMYFRKF